LSPGNNSLVIWRFSDGRPGHDVQSLGLCNALDNLAHCDIYHLKPPAFFSSLGGLLLGNASFARGLPRPDFIIGAGRPTHLPVLAAQRACGGISIIHMRPSLPFNWFDLCLIPEHDRPKPAENIISTAGALNCMEPTKDKDPNSGIILIGGPSRHFSWQDHELQLMIEKIVKSCQKNWSIFDSQRTPQTTRKLLENMASTFTYYPHQSTSHKVLEGSIRSASNIWVTMDSVSMLCEAITAGAATGIIPVPVKKANKIEVSVQLLCNEGQCTSFNDWHSGKEMKPPANKINESYRCAALILERFDHSIGSRNGQ
jgi:mitochondrial fission protein ELM1